MRKNLSIEKFKSESIVRGKGSFTPPANRNRTLDTTINYLKTQTFKETTVDVKNNLTKFERKGLQELKMNKDIIVKEADKRRLFGRNGHSTLRQHGHVTAG